LATVLANSNSVSPARLAAFEILLRVADGAYASVLLAAKEEELKAPDRALCHELVMGVLRNQLWLDHLVECYTKRKVEQLDLPVRVALRLGLYQLRFLARVPASAAVNESVNLTRVARLRSAGSFVNAVLRRAVREPDADPAGDIVDPVLRLSILTSHPRWLIERWLENFGFADTEGFAHANNTIAPTSFRVHRRADETEVLQRLRDAGADLVSSEIVRGAWRITGAGRLLTELTKAGEVYLQDEASQLVARVVEAQPAERILDLCAAPGSKTTQIANNANDAALLVASDLHEHRLRTVISSAKTQVLRSIRAVVLDGLQWLPFPDGYFDRVLIDAPCSGTGTLRRNPEIRWRISPADIADLAGRQKQLLFNAARVVRAGGNLIYSTCSVEPDENEAVVQQFLENNEGFTLKELPIDSRFRTATGAARTWPQRDGTDGFFICSFARNR
jgi:16S rRNA (cytosine967-C5)-methyltransferase